MSEVCFDRLLVARLSFDVIIYQESATVRLVAYALLSANCVSSYFIMVFMNAHGRLLQLVMLFDA